jgi:hypothetical protein
MGSAHVKWMPQFRGSALRLIAVCLVVVAVITAAVSLTVWKHEAANQRTDQSIAAFRDELLTGQLVGLFWHEREAMREELLTPSPAVLQEIRTVATRFSATVALFGRGATPEARLGGRPGRPTAPTWPCSRASGRPPARRARRWSRPTSTWTWPSRTS